MAEPKRRTYPTKPTFVDSAPPNTIPFPKQANMTVPEILAFFPNSINCADVVYRMVSNGGTRKTIHAITNTYRNFETEWSANCCGETMYRTMDTAGYTDWTITKHDLWHNKGDDAVDLTRMVQYCVQNAEDGWRYPKDYEELLDLLGAPAEVREPNTDGAVFRRWEDRKAPPPTPRPTPPPAGVGPVSSRTQARKRISGPRRKSATKRRSRKVSPGQGSLFQQAPVRKTESATAAIAVAAEAISVPQNRTGTPYDRGLAEYAPPPPSSAVTRPLLLSTVAQLLEAEGFAGVNDPYSAYAFGGPRRTPPFRDLEQIELPHQWDISGWAENLRWAFEQRVLFAKENPEALKWTESPEHMAYIERVRTQREWASDELLEQVAKDD
ncbi:hypothetical protein N0V91_008062 [Didymella pomorum]|uniref:Uncharacterized protein n=1 Tax=Didymella pomorum TaxID=749634 RepID=A0A9W8Z810_9PLEO|nr:hypothetical protein N0V91_008062 [Didymella pomorum]